MNGRNEFQAIISSYIFWPICRRFMFVMPKLEMDFHTHLSLLKHIDLINPNLELQQNSEN
jgi:hypothetical protein